MLAGFVLVPEEIGALFEASVCPLTEFIENAETMLF